jgi:hypothetical protein
MKIVAQELAKRIDHVVTHVERRHFHNIIVLALIIQTDNINRFSSITMSLAHSSLPRLIFVTLKAA